MPAGGRRDPGAPTLFYRLYAALARGATPLAYARVRAKLRRQDVAADRIPERIGHATLPRPAGRLAWFHAASVGESVSALALVERMLALQPDLTALITTGTGTSARVIAPRLFDRCVHQFAPLDSGPALTRFLDHWRPDAAIFVESELWPQMLVAAHRRGVPLALLNARLSQTSLRNWGKFPDTARWLLAHFAMIRTQDQATARGLLGLGADPDRLQRGPNLKAMAPPLPVDAAALRDLGAVYGADREAGADSATDPAASPHWLAASTHEGEEAAVLDAHMAARAAIPGLRLILVPRHPERAEDVARLVAERDLDYARRSTGAGPGTAEVYLADTMGEMGLWYALSKIVFLGGSFGAAGGHNLFEPALAGAAVLHGPRVANFAESYAEFDAADAAREVSDGRALGQAVVALLRDPPALSDMGDRARVRAAAQQDRLDGLAREVLRTLLPDADAGAVGADRAGAAD